MHVGPQAGALCGASSASCVRSSWGASALSCEWRKSQTVVIWEIRLNQSSWPQQTEERCSHDQKLLLLVLVVQEALKVAVVLFQRICSGTHLANRDSPALSACHQGTRLQAAARPIAIAAPPASL